MAQETEDAVNNLQVVSVMSIPAVGSTQTVETSSPDPGIDVSPILSPHSCELIDEIKEEDHAPPGSPKIVAFTSAEQMYTTVIEEQPISSTIESFTPPRVTYVSNDFKNTGTQFIIASPERPYSPPAETQRLPSVLEAAMKAEPKVEVER